MKKMNEYFFGISEISLHDALWFYGCITATLAFNVWLIVKFVILGGLL